MNPRKTPAENAKEVSHKTYLAQAHAETNPKASKTTNVETNRPKGKPSVTSGSKVREGTNN